MVFSHGGGQGLWGVAFFWPTRGPRREAGAARHVGPGRLRPPQRQVGLGAQVQRVVRRRVAAEGRGPGGGLEASAGVFPQTAALPAKKWRPRQP